MRSDDGMRVLERSICTMINAVLAWMLPLSAAAQQAKPLTPVAQPTQRAPLVFEQVTVIDVEHGKRLPAQRVVIVGNRIQAMGTARAVKLPRGAHVVDARGKYLIPGLWDMHVHPFNQAHLFYPLFLAYGVTGIRDASSDQPLDSLVRWRREILAGARLGPPRQVLSGLAINSSACRGGTGPNGVCPNPSEDSAAMRRLVDSLVAAGADMLKTYTLTRAMYFVLAAEARRLHVPFGGHLVGASASEASDSGAAILDHFNQAADLGPWCLGSKVISQPVSPLDEHVSFPRDSSLAQSRHLAEQFRRNDTWWALTLIIFKALGEPALRTPRLDRIFARLCARSEKFTLNRVTSCDTAATPPTGADSAAGTAESLLLHLVHQVDFPLVAGTDILPHVSGQMLPGLSLHAELEVDVAEGLTPLQALQSATLNPAKMLHATDSLGTVARGKLADLLLLDADPLTDIANTTTIRAVVANGRYYDRAKLDQLLQETQQATWDEVLEPWVAARSNPQRDAAGYPDRET